MNEIWKDIEGYEGRYQVSNLGNVKSLNYKHTGKEKLLKKCFLGKDKRYLVVTLYNETKRKNFKIHRLVANAFIPNPEGLPQVNHKDENPENNVWTNLEWCDQKYNNSYGTHNERSAISRGKAVRCIETGEEHPSVSHAARATGICRTTIGFCCNGKLKTAGGYHWEFILTQ